VLTVHAELEGGPFADDLTWFLEQAAEADIRVTTLRELLTARCATGKPLPRRTMGHGTVPGRHGKVSMPVVG
jgi:hypothetical protein